ncbi:MAG: hypothetical protein NZT61_06900 [Deltaproteobacteria bacterium]|nr:hypothetical protein [Deltaproteobacteria bacterium]
MDLKKFTVYVASFSYNYGQIPVDPFGHGGGFVFDCRVVFNPGRLPEYSDYTGLQKSVVEWLENHPSTALFWNSVINTVETALQLSDLKGAYEKSFCFGCTGGRHRSVYFANKLSDWLNEKGATVILEHIQLKKIGLL